MATTSLRRMRVSGAWGTVRLGTGRDSTTLLPTAVAFFNFVSSPDGSKSRSRRFEVTVV